jgi:uncharacterized membrane protein (UPF0127 family)
MIRRLKSVSPVILVGGVVLVVIATAVLFMLSKLQPSVPMYLGNGVFDARIAYTQADREKGLGGVSSIAENQALILAFPRESTWGIWMRDMKVPIDILWLDKDKKVVEIVKKASPEDGEKTVFVPKKDARYVVELPAGTADAKAIRVGRTAIFDVNLEDIR